MERDMTDQESKDQQIDELTEQEAAPADEKPIEEPPQSAAAPSEPPPAGESEEDEEEQDVPEELDQMEATLESVVEAVLFASDEPVKALKLCDIAEASSVKQIRECVKSLNRKYREGGFAFRIEKIAGGYQMMTLPVFNQWLSKLLKVRTDNKLSPAALETLAIIAYKQPIIRADIEAIRGVASGEVIRNLMYKGLVKIVGRAEILGRPMQYGTSKKFLEVFGLNSLKDLPNVEELKNPQS
jgi:segregation and condensation protein B